MSQILGCAPAFIFWIWERLNSKALWEWVESPPYRLVLQNSGTRNCRLFAAFPLWKTLWSKLMILSLPISPDISGSALYPRLWYKPDQVLRHEDGDSKRSLNRPMFCVLQGTVPSSNRKWYFFLSMTTLDRTQTTITNRYDLLSLPSESEKHGTKIALRRWNVLSWLAAV